MIPEFEIQQLPHLGFDAGQILLQLFRRQQIPLVTLAARITDHARRTAGNRDRPMTGLLKSPEHQQRQQAANMQTVGRGIETCIDRATCRSQPARQEIIGRGLVNQTPPLQVGEICPL